MAMLDHISIGCRDIASELLEIGIASNKIGLAIDFNKHSYFTTEVNI